MNHVQQPNHQCQLKIACPGSLGDAPDDILTTIHYSSSSILIRDRAQFPQDAHFSNSGRRNSFISIFKPNLFQRDDSICWNVSCFVDDSICCTRSPQHDSIARSQENLLPVNHEKARSDSDDIYIERVRQRTLSHFFLSIDASYQITIPLREPQATHQACVGIHLTLSSKKDRKRRAKRADWGLKMSVVCSSKDRVACFEEKRSV